MDAIFESDIQLLSDDIRGRERTYQSSSGWWHQRAGQGLRLTKAFSFTFRFSRTTFPAETQITVKLMMMMMMMQIAVWLMLLFIFIYINRTASLFTDCCRFNVQHSISLMNWWGVTLIHLTRAPSGASITSSHDSLSLICRLSSLKNATSRCHLPSCHFGCFLILFPVINSMCTQHQPQVRSQRQTGYHQAKDHGSKVK